MALLFSPTLLSQEICNIRTYIFHIPFFTVERSNSYLASGFHIHSVVTYPCYCSTSFSEQSRFSDLASTMAHDKSCSLTRIVLFTLDKDGRSAFYRSRFYFFRVKSTGIVLRQITIVPIANALFQIQHFTATSSCFTMKEVTRGARFN